MTYFIAFLVGGIAWRIGGNGFKWVRRFILPFAITLYSWIKRRRWTTILLFPLLVIAFSLGYGEKHPYWWKFIVGCLWVLPRFFILGFSPVALSVPFVWIGLFWLSNTKPFSNIFKWERVEVLVGGLVGISYI